MSQIGGRKMATVALGRSLVTPTDADAKAAVESGRMLAAHVQKRGIKLSLKNGSEIAELYLPAPAAQLLVELLQELGQGNAVALDSVQPELTTQQAADLLSVSRPYLVRLLDEGKIPSRKIGTHRRVLREDLLAFKNENHLQRQKALEELSTLDQELGLS
jgi:excisionase family DNA binding protein